MRWKVFLQGSTIKNVEKKVHELAEGLCAAEVKESGLMGGAAGVALFFAYYADYTGDLHFKGLAEEMVEQALNPPASLFPEFSFSGGYAGIAWTMRHLRDKQLLNFDAQEVLSKLDPLLEQHMMAEIGEGHYDYLHGALGYVLYFLNGPAAGKTELLASVMTELDRIAIKEADGCIKWRSVLDEDKGLEGFNLSLSHGLASIMIILSKIMSLGIEVDLCKKLLLGSYKYLRKQQLKGPGFASVYPSWALESLDEPSNSRMAWCYGDLGIAMACHTVGRTMNDKAIARHGDELLLSSCERKEPELNNVHDAGICHGAAGIALIYNTVYQKMPNDQIKEAAGHWLDESLKMDIHKNGIAGYRAWYHPQYGGWVKTSGLLEGAAGIGLALMSFLSTKDPAWKEALLL